MRLIKTSQHINRTQSHHSNPIKMRANADILHSLNCVNIIGSLAKLVEYSFAGPFYESTVCLFFWHYGKLSNLLCLIKETWKVEKGPLEVAGARENELLGYYCLSLHDTSHLSLLRTFVILVNCINSSRQKETGRSRTNWTCQLEWLVSGQTGPIARAKWVTSIKQEDSMIPKVLDGSSAVMGTRQIQMKLSLQTVGCCGDIQEQPHQWSLPAL